MFFKNLIFLLAVCALCVCVQAQDRKIIDCDKTDEKVFQKWLERDVFYIITKTEKENFLELKTNDEKEIFIENFWLRRDPTPNSEENEFREEYYERITYANENFSSGILGWKTDRGMIHILYGKPDKIEKGRSNFEGLENILFEKWIYKYLPGEPANTEFTFLDPTESNAFRLDKAKREKILKKLGRVLEICFSCPSL